MSSSAQDESCPAAVSPSLYQEMSWQACCHTATRPDIAALPQPLHVVSNWPAACQKATSSAGPPNPNPAFHPQPFMHMYAYVYEVQGLSIYQVPV